MSRLLAVLARVWPSSSRVWSKRHKGFSTNSIRVETLEHRAAICDIFNLDFELDHGFFPNDVYASEGWHESVINLNVPSHCVQSITWSTPTAPVIFAGYIHTRTEGRLIEFSTPTGFPPTFGIGFYWGPVDDTVVISATVVAHGVSATKSATFDIDEPSFDGAPVTDIDPYILDPDPTNGDGTDLEVVASVSYEATAHADRPGVFTWIQLVKFEATASTPAGVNFVAETPETNQPDGFLLDAGADENAYYTIPEPGYWETNEDGDAGPRMEDTPGVGLHLFNEQGVHLSAFKHLECTFSAQLWLMFQVTDADSQPVPVARAEWSWTATVDLRLKADGSYEDGREIADWMVTGSLQAGPLIEIDDWPTWDAIQVEEVIWAPV